MKKIGLWTQVYTFIPPKSVHFHTAVDIYGGSSPVSDLEGAVLVAVPMRLSLGDSRLLEGLLQHRLVEEPGDEILHAALLFGKIICDKRSGLHGPSSPFCKSRWVQGQFNFLQNFRYVTCLF